jgi:hypothetical protein
MPECLTAERVKAAFDKEKHIEELRQKEQQSFICPAEHEVIVVIHHHHLEMEDESQTANREMEFWKKYKPERHYEIVRHGHYITYVIARRANKTEQVENLRKKKKVKA